MNSSGSRVATYFCRARLIDALRLRLGSPSSSSPPPPPPDDPVVALHAIRAAPTPSSALAFFRTLPSPAPLSLFHALASRLANPASLPDLHSLLASFPVPPPPLLRLRLLANAGDHRAALAAFASVPAEPHRPAEAHNLVIHLNAAAGDHAAAVDAFGAMVREGALPNGRTYTVVIDHLAATGFVDQALEVFRLLPSLRLQRTNRQYNVLAEALGKAGRFDELRWLVREMSAVDGIMPGPQTRAAIAAMREAGHTEGTEDLVEELSPDSRIAYAVFDSDGEGDEEEADDDDSHRCGPNKETQLKPWLHPRELARALGGWQPEDVAELDAAGIVWTPRLVSKLLHNFRKPRTSWKFFCWVECRPGGSFSHNLHTVGRMIGILASGCRVKLAERLLAKVRADGILLPLATVRRIIDSCGYGCPQRTGTSKWARHSGKANLAVRLFREADSICGPVSRPNLALLCSSLMRTMAKCRRGRDATKLLEEMMATRGVLLNLQTFSGLMEHLAGEGDLKSVHRLFGLMRQSELRPDRRMYTMLISAYCKRDRATLALRLFDEMLGAGVVPDSPTVALLVKSLWREGKLRDVALVEARCEEIVATCGGELSRASPGHMWTVSTADLNKVYDIYSGCFRQQPDAENLTRIKPLVDAPLENSDIS